MAKDPYRFFRIEARELTEQIGKGVLALEQGAYQPEHINSLLRWAHTLKGAARVVRQGEIADLIHGVEDLLAPLRSDPAPLPRASFDRVLAGLDTITACLARLPAPDDGAGTASQPTPGRVAETAGAMSGALSTTLPGTVAGGSAAAPDLTAGAPLGEGIPRMARADVVEVDVLLEGLGEIGAELAAMRRAIDMLDTLRELAAAPPDAHGGSTLVAQLGLLERTMTAGAQRIERELQQTRDAAERLRLVPVAGIFAMLERSARDAAHSSGKEVVFEGNGGAMRVDGEVLDVLQGALQQLVRNAVAHGIEPPQQRLAAGKPRSGRIVLEASRRGNMAWFRCRDDGSGIDLAGLRRILDQRGVKPPAGDADLLNVLLKGGISTSSRVTELSGRGIGMDVVSAAMARVGGTVQARTSAAGAEFELRVPLSLAALEVLIVDAEGQPMALPLDAVRGTVRVAVEEVVETPEGQAIVFENRFLPLLPLTLGNRARARHQWIPRAVTAVVIQAQGALLALATTRLRGVDSVVVRALPVLAPVQATVLGLYLDSEGDPCVVLDPDQLATALSARRTEGRESAPAVAPILVVDDSLTTRMLESSILESAGYKVALAASAEEGLEMAAKGNYALFLVDVEMPGMDGFEFVARIRADPVLRDTPAILVTSLDTAAHKNRGLDAGAQDYIVKSDFDQGSFLARIGELVRR